MRFICTSNTCVHPQIAHHFDEQNARENLFSGTTIKKQQNKQNRKKKPSLSFFLPLSENVKVEPYLDPFQGNGDLSKHLRLSRGNTKVVLIITYI